MDVIYHIIRLNKKNYMIILVDAEKALDKIQHPICVQKETLKELEIQGHFLNPRKGPTKNLQLTSDLMMRD